MSFYLDNLLHQVRISYVGLDRQSIDLSKFDEKEFPKFFFAASLVKDNSFVEQAWPIYFGEWEKFRNV